MRPTVQKVRPDAVLVPRNDPTIVGQRAGSLSDRVDEIVVIELDPARGTADRVDTAIYVAAQCIALVGALAIAARVVWWSWRHTGDLVVGACIAVASVCAVAIVFTRPRRRRGPGRCSGC